jgi:hypothetical protein
MKVDDAPATQVSKEGFVSAALASYRENGQPLIWWAVIALLNFIAQACFRREMHPGEFGTFNTAAGMIGLLTVPALALNLAFTHYLARKHADSERARIDNLRASAFVATETFCWVWCALCVVLVFLLLPMLDLPRYSLRLFTLMNVLVAVGSVVGCALYERGNRLHVWTTLLLSAAIMRVIAGAGLASQEPWAESALAAFLFAGFITLTPALQARDTAPAARWAACRALLDLDFLLCAGATFSVLLALFLFSSADRIVAQSWFGVATNTNLGLVNWPMFDAYQTAGLLARSLLWGTQPLLWILFAHRSRLKSTTSASLKFFWIYLGVLVFGAIALSLLSRPISALFCGSDYQSTAHFIPSLAAAMMPLGLLQGLGVFGLASRRYWECFVLGACSIGYTLVLYLTARQPQLVPAYMFGGGLISLMAVLFVGVVRWGRKQP